MTFYSSNNNIKFVASNGNEEVSAIMRDVIKVFIFTNNAQVIVLKTILKFTLK